MTRLGEALYDIRNGIVGHNFSTPALGEDRRLGLAELNKELMEIKLTPAGLDRMHKMGAHHGES